MIRRSCTKDGWKDEQSEIYRTHLLEWVSNYFSHHKDAMEFQYIQVAVWSYILVTPWVEIQAETTVSKNINFEQRQENWQ